MSWFAKGSFVALGAVAALRLFAAAGALVVHTPSVPVGLYWRHATAAAPARGSYVCIEAVGPAAPAMLRSGVASGTLPQAWRSEPLVKRVAAVAGDVVSYDPARGVLVNGEVWPLSRVRSRDKTGRALTSATFPQTLEAGEVWLASEHELGYDSRYFGPVPVKALGCEARPVWTW
jgi:conjugative transfer signal peptidase TraF